MSPNTLKKPVSIPLIVVSVALLGGAMFVLGRSSAPNPPLNSAAMEGHEDSAEGHEEGDHTEHAEGDEEHGGEEHGEGEAISFSPEALQSAQIKVEPISLKPQVSGLPFNGQIEASPDNVAHIASIVPGRITRLLVTIGQKVRKGETLALIESRSVGEAQAAYSQAVARLQNARSGYAVTLQQSRAGVFSRGPLEAARRGQIAAAAEVRSQETNVRQARVALDNVTRLAKTGSYARPSLEAARAQYAAALESLKSAQAAQDNAGASVQAARSELARRRQIAQSGGYNSRPVEEAHRVLAAAEAARATAQSQVATTRSNLNRAQSLIAEGLVSTRDVEVAQTAFDTATAQLQSARADETAASQELARQRQLATSNVAGNAEVGEAQATLAGAQADERTRSAQVARAREGLRLANLALQRERAVFSGNVANRREFSTARGNLENALNALEKARQTLRVSEAELKRESLIYRQNLNNIAQVQSARATLVSAQSDLKAAQTTLSLLKSAPNGSAIVPLHSTIDGVVQVRDVSQGEVVEADKDLMTIVDLSTVHVDMHLPERDISLVRIGAPVSVRVDAVPGQSFSGWVELVHTQLDPKTRTLEAHAELANPGTLRPGMFARGTIGSGKQSLALRVPADAVQDMEGKKVVFVAGEKAGQFAAREVETGPTTGGQTLIKSGLSSGEKIVVKGAFMVKAQAMKAELGHEH